MPRILGENMWVSTSSLYEESHAFIFSNFKPIFWKPDNGQIWVSFPSLKKYENPEKWDSLEKLTHMTLVNLKWEIYFICIFVKV